MRTWMVVGGLAFLAGCGAADGDSSGKNTISGTTIENNGPCSFTVVIGGAAQTVKGNRNSTITVGNVTITFGPDCSVSTSTSGV